MKPRIVEKDAFHVVGLEQRFLPGKVQGIPELWQRFMSRMDQVRDPILGTCYGVCVPEPEPGKPLTSIPFRYIACVGVRSLDRVPDGMTGFTVPKGKYAVWTHRGPIGELVKTIHAVWFEWIPAEGLKPTGAPDFELYDQRFKMDAPDSEVDVYVPVA